MNWNTTKRSVAALAALVTIVAIAPAALAGDQQPCEPAWYPFESGGQIGLGSQHAHQVVAQTVWNGDLIAGGRFPTAGGETVNNIARWDGSAWQPFSSGGQIGVDGGASLKVQALTVWNGDLIVGGNFESAGGQPMGSIARWDGSAWHPFTSGGEIGVGPDVRALTVWNGDLIAGGAFNSAGGQAVGFIARWDGSAWQPFSSGGQIGLNNYALALTVWNGDLIAGGIFATAGGQTVNSIARWDGSAWHPFTSGGEIGVHDDSTFEPVFALTVWNEELIAGGNFTTAGGQAVNNIARWDGSAWHPFTAGKEVGVSRSVFDLTVWNSDLIAGGEFSEAGGQAVNRIARWDGSAWHPFTSGGQIGVESFGTVFDLTVWNGDLVAAGGFGTAGGQTVNNIARWDGCALLCPADFVASATFQPPGDGQVDAADLAYMLGEWGRNPGSLADIVTSATFQPPPDGVVDAADLAFLLGAWGECE